MTQDEQDRVSLLELGTDRPDLTAEDDEDEDKLVTDLKDVSKDTRKEISRERVRKAVRDAGAERGVTRSEVAKMTGLTRQTAGKHLEDLCRLREVYSLKRSGTFFYYPNGKPLHAFETKRVESGDVIIDIQVAEGPNGDYFVHITEKRFTLMDGETTEGAVMLPLKSVGDLAEALHEVREEVRQA